MYRLVLAFLLAVVALPIGQTRADVFDPDDYLEIVVELDSTIAPVDYAGYFLTQVKVPQADQYERLNHIYEHAINGFSVWLTPDEYANAGRLDLVDVRSLNESQQVSVTPITSVEGAMPVHPLEADREVVPTGVRRANALPEPGADYSGVDVAVIDTGVDQYAPDLDVVGGIDCVGQPGEPPRWGYDGYGHGTHVAGTIAAKINGEGVVGIAPGARIWSVKVLDDKGSGSWASVLCGLDFVAKYTDVIEVANMSLGGNGGPSACGGSDPMHNAICAVTLTTVVVVAAGNSSTDAAGYVPASYPEVVTVSAFADFDGQDGGSAVAPQDRCYAMSSDDFLAAFSNYGEAVDIAAPGTCILSTLPGTFTGMGAYSPNYGYASGTSMATPLVTGCVAKYLSVNPDQRDRVVDQILTWSDAQNPAVKGDKDGIHEPLLECSTVPRYETSTREYQADGE